MPKKEMTRFSKGTRIHKVILLFVAKMIAKGKFNQIVNKALHEYFQKYYPEKYKEHLKNEIESGVLEL
ncbi:MAG: hypothetical protein V3V00_15915 [Saprospiraceae bacterium]